MRSFALVTFKPEGDGQLCRKNIIRHSFSCLKSLFIKPSWEDWVRKIELMEDLLLYTVGLPYRVDEISRYKSRLNKFFSQFTGENHIKCFLPRSIPDGVLMKGCIKLETTGRLLFKSLLIYILKEIYEKKGILISELDICIIEGENRAELREIVDLLSPMVKYITVIAEDRDTVDADMARIYEDTGLSVRVTNELRKSLRDVDLIINLGNLAGISPRARINPKAVILNYGKDEINELSCENVILNGIKIRMGKDMSQKIDHVLMETYGETELIETILLFIAGLEEKVTGQYDLYKDCMDKSTVKGLSDAFVKCGCSIKEFFGRRSMIEPKDIVL